MGVIYDAVEALLDFETKVLLFGAAKKKYTHYVEVRDRIRRQPLTDAEWKAVGNADKRSRWARLALMVAAYVPPVFFCIWTERGVQNRFLRMIVRRPHLIGMCTISAIYIEHYARPLIFDMFFNRDSDVVQLTEKYQRDASGGGIKDVEALVDFACHPYGISNGSASGSTNL